MHHLSQEFSELCVFAGLGIKVSGLGFRGQGLAIRV